MAPSTSWVRSSAAMVSTIRTGRGVLPLSLPLAAASRTAFSISRCDVTPTSLRNLRIDVLRASSFMVLFSGLAGSLDLTGAIRYERCAAGAGGNVRGPAHQGG